MEFDWDNGNRPKCLKHGLTLVEIEFLFRNDPLVSPDRRHSDSEKRYIAVGRTQSGHPAFVAYGWRGDKIRPISARYMHTREVKKYEAQNNT